MENTESLTHSRETLGGRTLIRIVGVRIVIFAALAATLQAIVIFSEYFFDDAKLADLMVQHETLDLAEGLGFKMGEWVYNLPEGMGRYRATDAAYVTRIRTPDGLIIYSDCDANCEIHLLPLQVNPPDTWSRIIGKAKSLQVAGGRTVDIKHRKFFIEIAILNDHDHVSWRVYAAEFRDHLAVPMSIMLAFLLLGTLVSIHFALRPVRDGATAAEKLNPLDPSRTINISGMPREIAEFGDAINRHLSRIRSLMDSRRVFTTAIAHEIRTPLAMIQLDLGHIDHPRARKIEREIVDLARFISQITALGRLESFDRRDLRPVDIAEIARKVVADIAPLAYDRGKEISFNDAGPGSIDGYSPLIYDAIRNLIENAIKHTSPGTKIEVVAGPGPQVVVRDDAGLYQSDSDLRADRLGIGLQIVRQIMAIHLGELQVESAPGRSTSMRLKFAST